MRRRGVDGRAVFLDRDGTIIEDTGYINDPASVRLLEGVGAALSELERLGYALVIVSNQSGVGRGMFSESEAEAVDRRTRALLDGEGIRLAGAYYCYDPPWSASCFRKPGAGLLRKARDELGLDLEASFLIGDKESDMIAGRSAGCKTILIAGEGRGRGSPPQQVPEEIVDFRATSWAEALEYIRGQGNPE